MDEGGSVVMRGARAPAPAMAAVIATVRLTIVGTRIAVARAGIDRAIAISIAVARSVRRTAGERGAADNDGESNTERFDP